MSPMLKLANNYKDKLKKINKSTEKWYRGNEYLIVIYFLIYVNLFLISYIFFEKNFRYIGREYRFMVENLLSLFILYIIYKILLKFKIVKVWNRGKIFTDYVNQRLFHLELLLKEENILYTNDSIEVMIKEIDRIKKNYFLIISIDYIKEILLSLILPYLISLSTSLLIVTITVPEKNKNYSILFDLIKEFSFWFIFLFALIRIFIYLFEKLINEIIFRKYNELISDLRLLQIKKR